SFFLMASNSETRVEEFRVNSKVDNWYSHELVSSINTGQNNFFFGLLNSISKFISVLVLHITLLTT
ncbi:MAG TPA: hypothetical protein VF623_11660, partial [Segetibacter sp.]